MAQDLLEKLDGIQIRFKEIEELIVRPDVIADQKKFAKINKDYKNLKEITDIRANYLSKLDSLKEAEDIINEESDADLLEMAKEEKDIILKEVPKRF